MSTWSRLMNPLRHTSSLPVAPRLSLTLSDSCPYRSLSPCVLQSTKKEMASENLKCRPPFSAMNRWPSSSKVPVSTVAAMGRDYLCGGPACSLSSAIGRSTAAAIDIQDRYIPAPLAQPEFEQSLKSCPEASLAVMRVLCDRLRESQAQPVNTGATPG